MNERNVQNHHPFAISRGMAGTDDAGLSELYDTHACELLGAVNHVFEQRIPDIINLFYRRLAHLKVGGLLLDMLPESERIRLHTQQIENLKLIASPVLTSEEHYKSAIRVGRTHAIVGLSRQDLVRSRSVLFGALQECIDEAPFRGALSVVSRRLNRDLACQLDAYESLHEARQRVVLDVTQLAWAAQSYADLIRKLVGIIGSLDEVAGCAIGRPDHLGVLRFEAVSGDHMVRYLAAGERSNLPISIRSEDPTGQGPAGLAWRSGEPARVLNFQTDPCAAIWREAAHLEGFRSSVAIPIRDPAHRPLAILSLYSPLPGGYSGAGQRLLVDLLQTILGFAMAQIQAAEGAVRTIAFATRQRWIALMRTDGLEMFYQPIMDLACGSVKKVEVLARLRDGERLITPGEFLGVLSADDYFTLYFRGLKQALGQRNIWLKAGLEVGLSVNLPTEALRDKRYLQATQEALEEFSCAGQYLALEVLETERVPTGLKTCDEFGKFKAMGILLAEDDLGSGHSSLARLNEFPFDLVKIDRSIVGFVNRETLDPLRFVYQLTRLGHSLGMSVVAEGIEDAALLPALQILGVDAVQGYAISRPMPSEELIAWVSAQSRTATSESVSNAYSHLAKMILWEERLVLLMHETWSVQWLKEVEATWAGTLQSAGEGGSFGLSCAAPGPDRMFDEQWQRDLARVALTYGIQSPDYRLARDRIASELG